MHPKALPVPKAASDDPKGIELLRVWAAKGKQHVSLSTNLWNDPATWGIMLVDLARHIAAAYEQAQGIPSSSALQRVKEGFDAEFATATDEPSGEILE
jgi:hypothetical protein